MCLCAAYAHGGSRGQSVGKEERPIVKWKQFFMGITTPTHRELGL